MLGLLSDDYQVTSPVKEAKTIVIEKTGEMIKQVWTEDVSPAELFVWKPAFSSEAADLMKLNGIYVHNGLCGLCGPTVDVH